MTLQTVKEQVSTFVVILKSQKLQFLHQPLEACSKSESIPIDHHLKCPTLQHEKHVYSLLQKRVFGFHVNFLLCLIIG